MLKSKGCNQRLMKFPVFSKVCFKLLYVMVILLLTGSTAFSQMSVYKDINFSPRKGQGTEPYLIAIDENRGRAYVANYVTANISVIDLETYTVIDVIFYQDFERGIRFLYFNNISNSLYVGSLSLWIFDGNTHEIKREYDSYSFRNIRGEGQRLPTGFDCFEENSRIYIPETGNNQILVFDTIADTLITTFEAKSPVSVEGIGSHFYIASFLQNKLYIYDKNTFDLQDSIEVEGKPYRIIALPNGRMIVGTKLPDRVLQYENNQLINSYNIDLPQSANIAYNVFRNELYIISEDGTKYIDLDTWSVSDYFFPPETKYRPSFGYFYPQLNLFCVSMYYTNTVGFMKMDDMRYLKSVYTGASSGDVRIIGNSNELLHIDNSNVNLYKMGLNNYDIKWNIPMNEWGITDIIVDDEGTYAYYPTASEIHKVDLNRGEIISSTEYEYVTGNRPFFISDIHYLSENKDLLCHSFHNEEFPGQIGLHLVNTIGMEHKHINFINVSVLGEESWYFFKSLTVPGDNDICILVTPGNRNLRKSLILKVQRDNLALVDSTLLPFWATDMVYSEKLDKMILSDYSAYRIVLFDRGDLTSPTSEFRSMGITDLLLYDNMDLLYAISLMFLKVYAYSLPDATGLDTLQLRASNYGRGVPVSQWMERDIDVHPHRPHFYVPNLIDGKVNIVQDPRISSIPLIDPPQVEVITGDNQVSLNLEIDQAVSRGVNIYRRFENEDHYIKINSLPVRTTRYVDLNLTNGIACSYQFTALNLHDIEGERSDPVSETPLELPDFEFVVDEQAKLLAIADDTEFLFNLIPENHFISEIIFSAKNLPPEVEVNFNPPASQTQGAIEATFYASLQAEAGTFPVEVCAEGGGQTHIIELILEVVSDDALTCNIDPQVPQVNTSLIVYGRTYPPESKQITLNFLTFFGLNTQILNTDGYGYYQYELSPDVAGEWQIWTALTADNNVTSDTLIVGVEKAVSRISCTTDLSNSAEEGWIASIKGRVFPASDFAQATLIVHKPDNNEETIDGVLINDQGYYGHTLALDQKGAWHISASWPGNESLMAAESNELLVTLGMEVGRSIIVRGYESSETATVMDTLANYVYNILRSRRFTDDMIYYLNPDTEMDVNGDGLFNEVDTVTNLSNFDDAVLNWALPDLSDSLHLTICLVGEGSENGFRLNETELLTADHLQSLVNQIKENTTTDNINIIFETDYARQYVETLQDTVLTLITATDTTRMYFMDEGHISFGRFFWNGIYESLDVGEAFLRAKDIVLYLPQIFYKQIPLLDANGNGIANELIDGELANQVHIGGAYLLGDFPPYIVGSGINEGAGGNTKYSIREKYFSSSLQRATTFGVNLWIRLLDDMENKMKVKLILFPPDSDEFHLLDLTDDNGDGKYETTFFGFESEGMYNGIVYAIDQSGHSTNPIRKQFYLTHEQLTSIDEGKIDVPKNYRLKNNYPNPFNVTTIIPYDLPEDTHVELIIYDILGRQVRSLVNEKMIKGYRQTMWNGRDDMNKYISSGIYFYKLKTEKFQQVKKLVLLK